MLDAAKNAPEVRGGFRFRGGHLALDLTATLAGRFGGHSRDLLSTPADLDRWLASSGLANAEPGTTQGDVELARRLREAIYALATGKPSKAALDGLNAIAASAAAPPQLTDSARLIRTGTASQLLTTLAQQAVELLGGELSARIRQCERSGCAILFLDLSRSARRRWCAMDACGNRAKAEAFRRRSRGS